MVNGRYVGGLQEKCRLGLLALRARRPRPIGSSRLSPRGVPDQPHNDQKLMKLASPLSNPLMGMGESALKPAMNSTSRGPGSGDEAF